MVDGEGVISFHGFLAEAPTACLELAHGKYQAREFLPQFDSNLSAFHCWPADIPGDVVFLRLVEPRLGYPVLRIVVMVTLTALFDLEGPVPCSIDEQGLVSSFLGTARLGSACIARMGLLLRILPLEQTRSTLVAPKPLT